MGRKPPFFVVANSPLGMDFEPTPDELTRFLKKVKLGPSDCWLWQGQPDEKGYGQFHFRGKTIWAHRWAYAVWKRPLITGFTVEHKCRNPSCVNPWHLELLTNSENAAEGNRNRNGDVIPF